MKHILSWITAFVTFLVLGVQYAIACVGIHQPACYANSIASGLKVDLILDAAMEALKETLTPLALFSTAFRDVPLQGTNKMLVPYYPLDGTASKDYVAADGYVFDTNTNTLSKEVTINKRKYQPLSFTSEEVARQPQFDPERLGRLKGLKLAEDVLKDIWSQITLANYGVHVFAGGAGDFDVDDVIDIETAVNEANWPVAGRGLVIKPAYLGGLKKDMNANGGLATFGRDSNGNAQNFPMLESFNVAMSNIIPANGQNLVGFAVHPSAMLIGFSPIAPTSAVRKQLSDYRTLTDPDIGLTLEYREWGDADKDTEKRVIEVNYGYGLGEAAALKRLLSVAP